MTTGGHKPPTAPSPSGFVAWPTLVGRALAGRPWKEAILWLCFLGPFFFLTYGFANNFTASRAEVGSFVFAWERQIPFLPWTVIPYWSIDVFYGLSLFVCATRGELRTHAKRLIMATTLCVVGFLLFPMRMTFARPEVEGISGLLFSQLANFDLPYNQAPSLHICLLIVLYDLFARHTPARYLPLVRGWSLLIAVSVLTTWQHHFIDVITGAAAGVICCYALPFGGWSLRAPSLPKKAMRLAFRYAAAGDLFIILAIAIGVWVSWWGWLLLWPAASLAMVAFGQILLGPSVMQKGPDGELSLGAFWLLLPYRTVAALTRRHYLQKLPPAAEIAPNLFLGGYPDDTLPFRPAAVLDLCAEYPRSPALPRDIAYRTLPLTDLMPPAGEPLRMAVQTLTELHLKGPTLIHCALGLTRSASVAACYLVNADICPDLPSALAHIDNKRPGIVLSREAREVLQAHCEAEIIPRSNQ